MRKRGLVIALCAVAAPLALGLPHIEISVSAWQHATCDFLTGGGFIYPTGSPMGGKGTFGVAGGCKHSSFWGHLEYHDHGIGVKVHGTQITGYMIDTTVFPDPFARLICGKGKTDYGDVTFVVRAKDGGEPGCNKDEFDIQLQLQGAVPFYTTFGTAPHKLGGGNIQLHRPNYSNTGVFGGMCPAVVPPGPNPTQQGPDVAVAKAPPAGMETVNVNTPAVFNITVTAGGTSNSTNVTLADTLPPRPPGTDWTLSGPDAGMCNLDPMTNVLSCSFGTMLPGDIRSISVSTTALATDATAGGIDNTATVSTTAADIDLTNNSSTGHVNLNPIE